MFKSTGSFTNFKSGVFLGTLFALSFVPSGAKAEQPLMFATDTSAILLKEINISSDVVSANKSPLRIKTIDQEEIEFLSTGRTFPEIMKNTPGIYATAESGSYGDAKINIRGFKQENISVLLNGTPISGLTTGSMFWNNWLGLTDATAQIQVQKGIGGSMLSDNSVGGTVNILTKSPSYNQFLTGGYSCTESGMSKLFFNYNSGALSKGWAFTMLASYVWGQGWVEQTSVNSWAYMATVTKKINSRNSLLFTLLGSPEEHSQRSTRLSYDEMERYGRHYNKNWGVFTNPDGSTYDRTINKNIYHKPYFTLNHFYNTDRLSLSSAVYVTVGNGGGYWTQSKGRRVIDYQKDGHIDWNSVVKENRDDNGGSKSIVSDYLAGHTQIGAKSSLNLALTDKLALDAGVHYQNYRTWEKEQITDLLGGDYWYEDYQNNSLAGEAGRNPIKRVGDYIRTDNGKNINFMTLYSMLTYSPSKFVFNLGASLNVSAFQRWDNYNYVDDIDSKVAVATGGSFKTGMLYKMNRSNSLYVNGALYSRVPYSNVYFANGNNKISEGVKNEKNVLGEAGYRFLTDNGGVETTFYTAYWINKSLMSSPYKPLEEESYRFMITGLNALHYGVEIDAWYNFTHWFRMDGYASVGSWRWENDVNAKIYDQYSGHLIQQIDVYSDGLPVGDAPQTQLGTSVEIKPWRSLVLRAECQYNGRYWSDFEPSTRTNPDDSTDPYRIPSYTVFNAGASWNVNISKLEMNLFFNLNNVFDKFYIERGRDGRDHSAASFTGYWAQGRNFNFGVKFKL